MIRKLFSVTSITFFLKPLGYLRDILIAYSAGISFYTDIFFFLYSIPSSIRQILYSTSFNAAFVPFYKDLDNQNQQIAKKFSISLIIYSIAILFPIILIIAFFMENIIQLFNFSFINSYDEIIFSSKIARVFLIYLFFLFIGATLIGINYSYKRFIVPTILSGVINISIILTAIINIYYNSGNYNSLFLQISFAVVIGSFLEILVLYYSLRKFISLNDIIIDIKSKGRNFSLKILKKFAIKLFPSIGFETMHQLNRVYTLAFASIAVGGISAFYYANIIASLPLSIFGISLSIILIPYLSSNRSDELLPRISLIQNGIRFGIFFSFPITFFCFVFSDTIIGSFFMRGEFNIQDLKLSSNILSALSIGIPANILFRSVIVYYFANLNTTKPFKLYFITFLFNALVLFIYGDVLGIAGIAYVYTLSVWLFLLLILYNLFSQKIILLDYKIIYYSFKYTIFGLIMVLSQIYFRDFFSLAEYSFSNLFLLVFFGSIIYLLLVILFDKLTLNLFLQHIFKKKIDEH